MSLHLRPATRADVPTILGLIEALAEYEKLRSSCVATIELIEPHLFGQHPHAEVVPAELEGPVACFAWFLHTFSTFQGKPGIYLEDLYVKPELRGNGIGKALVVHLARLAVLRDCGRLEWNVLNWNAPSIDFYKSLGALPLDDWTKYRLEGEALRDLGLPAASI